jgi:hypothetical protein
VVFRNVLPRPRKRSKAKFVQLPVTEVQKLRKLGIGPLYAYMAIRFQVDVEGKNEVVVPARTWRMFGCRTDNRYLHAQALVKAGMVETLSMPSGKASVLRLIGQEPTSDDSADQPPTKTGCYLRQEDGPSPVLNKY